MFANADAEYSDVVAVSDEIPWQELYTSLRSLARYLVFSFGVPSWKGQEDDIIEDIAQESIRRLVEYFSKVERGEVPPVQSLKRMLIVIAQNYCKDLRRRDRRLAHILNNEYTVVARGDQSSLLDSVTENVYHELLFILLAHEIINFPEKQRTALLTDLANRMSFNGQPTALQRAFQKVGVELQDYQQPLPANSQERSRHVSLLNHAYKRVAGLSCIQRYIAVA